MDSPADLIEIHGGLEARRLADLLDAPFVAGDAPAAGAGRPLAVHWGPIGWAVRRTGGAARCNIWRWYDLDVPITDQRRWALGRFDHLVAGDDTGAGLLSDAVDRSVSVIPGHVEVGSSQGAPGGPCIGWLSDRPAEAMFDLLIAARRIREGAVGSCPNCGGAAVGRFDPWTSELEAPRCCGRALARSDPTAVAVELAVPEENPRVEAEFARLAAWVGLGDGARWVRIDPEDRAAEAAVVGSWSAQLVLDDQPVVPRGVEVAGAVGTPCVVARFGPWADLDSSIAVAPVTRLTPNGAVRATPEPATSTLALRRLLDDQPRRQDAVAALGSPLARCRPGEVRGAWVALAERLVV